MRELTFTFARGTMLGVYTLMLRLLSNYDDEVYYLAPRYKSIKMIVVC